MNVHLKIFVSTSHVNTSLPMLLDLTIEQSNQEYF